MGAAAAAPARVFPAPVSDLGPTVSENHPVALSFNYTAMIGNAPPGSCGCFLLNGGSSEDIFQVWKGFAAVAEVAGNRSSRVPSSQQGLSLITVMGGPRYSYQTAQRLTLYGQFLVGAAHGFDGYFPKAAGQSSGSASSLAFAPGAGLEIGLRDWLSVRAIEAEYLRTNLPNDVNGEQHNVRISSGIVFRFR